MMSSKRAAGGSFSFSFVLSLVVHAVIVCSFFRIISAEKESTENTFEADTLKWEEYLHTLSPKEMAALVFAPLSDSLRFDSLWVADSSYFLDLFDTSPVIDVAWKTFADNGWYGTPGERAAFLDAMIGRYRTSMQTDSLFALSEMLRQYMLDRILDRVRWSPTSLPDSLTAWKRLIDRLATALSHPSDSSSGSFGPASQNGTLGCLLADSNLVKLWKEAMLFSLRQVALDSLRRASRDAALYGLSKYGFHTCATPLPPHEKNGDDAPDDYPLSGIIMKAGAVSSGIETVSPEAFEEVFSVLMRAIVDARGIGTMLALFPSEELIESLAQEAKSTLLSALDGNEGARRWVQSIDFRNALRKALAETKRCNAQIAKNASEFLETIQTALGDDLTSWLRQWPSPAQLGNNPHFFDDWARDYLSLLSSMASHPNMVMPNLEKFAEAARKIRNRLLPQSFRIVMGGGSTAPADSIDYFIPQWVYLPPASGRPPPDSRPRPLRKPVTPFHAFGGAVRKTGSVAIDGDLAEWQQCAPYALCGTPTGSTEQPSYLRKGDNCLMVQWDNSGLYCAYAISDRRDNPRHVAVFWDTDALELFLDPHNRKDPVRMTGRSYQFWIWPRAPQSDVSTGISVFSDPKSFTPRPLRKGAIRFASIRRGGGYTCEAFIPASLVKRWMPLPGKIIGFNFSINNGESLFLRWVTNLGANISLHPNLWGDLLLMGSDAVLRTDPEDFLLPGAALNVTVIDHDMNISPVSRDKIWARAGSALTGDRIPFDLIETDVNTGVFAGELGTVFAFSQAVKNRLSTRPGDKIEIFYLDQYRAGGEKNVSLTQEIVVARGVMTLRR